ncbi:unnamed protein product [Pelagomonas calceolata]|uniref:Uncharacterized protein n=1 Tax=Pelagomonas calceolata TaxID=35677 RepID=A0A8J2WMV1_9STRA|nr:unnamed protein product [Pelagomonas calceolata]
MDFERVIFRVHAAALGPLERNEERCRVKPREACRACSECLLVVAVGLLLVTTALHATLGTDRCLAPRLKERLGRYDNGSYVDWRLPRDAVVKIRLVNELPDDDDLFVGENGVAPQRHDDDDGIPGDFRRLGECPLLKPAPSSECDGVLNCDARMAPDTVCGGDDKCGTVANGCYKVQHAHHTPAPSPFRWRVPSGDYTLARDLHLLALNDAFLAEHRVRAYNVSVSMRCLDAASALASVFHRYVLGYDTPLANQAMETLGSSGALRNDNTNIITRWRRSDARRRRLSQRLGAEAAFKWLLRRAGVAVTSLLALFLLSTVTAAVLRVLVASGVCGAFALWYLLSSTRFAQRLDFQALARAYPWLGAVLGAPLELLRAQGREGTSLLCAHAVRVVVAYALYEAAQFAFARWLYSPPLPPALGLCCFGLMLGWEYATLAHCRSAASIAFLPKLNALYFLACHGTFYAVSRPYALLNCGVAALFMCHATLYCILELELPALVRGDIDATTPRARRTELPWPALDAMLPPTWSLYMPLVPNDDDQFPEEEDMPAELPRPPPPAEDEDDGVELVDLNRAPAPAVATTE